MFWIDWLQESRIVTALSGALSVGPGVVLSLMIVWGGLVVGSAARLIRQWRRKPDDPTPLRRRLLGWWILLALFTAAVLLGRWGVVLLFAVGSGVAMHEFIRGVGRDADQRLLRGWAYAGVAGHYLLVGLAWSWAASLVAAMIVPLGVAIHHVLLERTEGAVRNVSELTWGLLLTTFCVSHVPLLLLTTPEATAGASGAMGWVVFAVVLTQTNDISQAVVGRATGGVKFAPTVSPNKTWAGFAGGLAVTVVVGLMFGPMLTPVLEVAPGAMGWVAMAGVGAMISIGAMAGDLIVSVVKRDRGLDDMGRCIPGQGGAFDRLDSLTVTGPLVYLIVHGVGG